MIKSELYNGKIYAGDTPFECSFVVEQTAPLQLTVRAGHLQTTGQAKIIHQNELRQKEINNIRNRNIGEDMPSKKARRIKTKDLNSEDLSDLKRMGKIIKHKDDAKNEVTILEEYLDEIQRQLGTSVDIVDERMRIWINGEKKKLHVISSDFVWDVKIPASGEMQYWLGIGSDERGNSSFYIGQTETGIDSKLLCPSDWTNFQLVIFPFVVNETTETLPDIMVLTVVTGFPPNDLLFS